MKRFLMYGLIALGLLYLAGLVTGAIRRSHPDSETARADSLRLIWLRAEGNVAEPGKEGIPPLDSMAESDHLARLHRDLRDGTARRTAIMVGDSSLLRSCRELVNAARREGVIGKIIYGESASRVWVRPSFWLLEFDAKLGLCRAIGYEARAEGFSPDLILRDAMNDKEIGTMVLGRLSLN